MLLVKGIFCLAETYFYVSFSFHMVETDFLSCANSFLLFNFFFLQVETFAEINGNKFFGKDFVPVESDFPPNGNYFILFCGSFLQVETVTETS